MSKEINFICGLAGFVGLTTCRPLGPGQLISKDFVELYKQYALYIYYYYAFHAPYSMYICVLYVCMSYIYLLIVSTSVKKTYSM